MDEVSASRIKCPGCGGTSFLADASGAVVCEYCQADYVPPRRICPGCEAPYDPHTPRCSSCGTELERECLKCGALNPWFAPKCLVCGQGLDVVDAMFDRLTRRPADQLHRVREMGTEIKSREEAASQARLDEMWDQEEQRLKKLAKAQAERERQERLVIGVVVGVVALVVLVAIVIAIFAQTP